MNMPKHLLRLLLVTAAAVTAAPTHAIVLATQEEPKQDTADAAGAGVTTAEDEADGTERAQFPRSRFGMPAQDPMKMEIAEDRAFQMAQKPGAATRAPAELKRTASQKAEKKADAAAGGSTAETKVPVQPLDDVVFDAKSSVQEIALIATEDGFFPKTIMVSKEIPVRLYVTGASSNTLCFMMDAFQVRRQIRSHKVEEIQLTAKKAGLFRFHCPITNVEGTLIVRDFAHRDK